eukprot:2263594-Pyramimonas_sp.AAC.1
MGPGFTWSPRKSCLCRKTHGTQQKSGGVQARIAGETEKPIWKASEGASACGTTLRPRAATHAVP